MNNLLLTFIALNIINVIIQTIKSLATVKAGKEVAAIMNALAYGFYTIVVIYMVCELPLMQKVLVVGLCNLVGVYIVKLLEEKAKKDKLWKIELTIKSQYKKNLILDLECYGASFNYIGTNDENYTTFNIYSKTQEESAFIKKLCGKYFAKYFISETKIL